MVISLKTFNKSLHSPKLSIKSLGPFLKGISGPKNAYAQITLPLYTGDYHLTSKSIVSVSQECILWL